jgi:hypothetical protein
MYRRRLEEWQSSIAEYCGNRGVHFIPVTTDLPWEKLVMQTLRVSGVLK